jgi:hypothetical protein
VLAGIDRDALPRALFCFTAAHSGRTKGSCYQFLLLGQGRHHARKDGNRVRRHPNKGGRGERLNRIKDHGGSEVLWVTD